MPLYRRRSDSNRFRLMRRSAEERPQSQRIVSPISNIPVDRGACWEFYFIPEAGSLFSIFKHES
jgi:hypothetical protein